MTNTNPISRRDFLRFGAKTAVALGAAGPIFSLASLVGCGNDRKGYETQLQNCDNAVDIPLAEGQKIDAVKETLSQVDLPSLLEGTAIGTMPDAAQVDQYLRFGPFPSNVVQSSAVWSTQNELGQTGNFLYFKDGDRIFEYELSFENGLASQVDGSNTLSDLLGKDLPALGVQRRIVKAKQAGDMIDLILMAGEFKSHAVACGPQTHVIDGKEYEVNVPYASSEYRDAQYSINGELTPVLSPGETYVLADGTRFGHGNTKGTNSEAMIVDFAFNADALEWADDATQDGLEGSYTPLRNGEPVEDAKVRIVGQPLPGGMFELSSMRYALLADGKQGDIYIGKGESLRDKLNEPAGIPGRFDIIYAGQNADNKHVVRVCAK